jgi:hypothetical protein
MNALQTNGSLEAPPEKAQHAVQHALSRYEGIEPGEERGDIKFAEILSVKTFIEDVIAGYMDSIYQDQLVALQEANGAIVTDTQETGASLENGNMQDYMRKMSGLVSSACEAVGLATKVQCAKDRDFDGYRAELSDKAIEMLDGARQKYLGEQSE